MLSTKKIILFTVLTVLLLAAIFVLIFSKDVTLTPATPEQVKTALEHQSISYSNETEYYAEEWNAGERLRNAIIAVKDDVNFSFFVFDNDNDAERIRSSNMSLIRQTRYSTPNVEYKEALGNHIIYTLKCDIGYTVSVRVGSTFVYAVCDESGMDTVKAIMAEIGYL